MSQSAIDLIKRFEGCELRAYHDSGRGVLTIGWGSTGSFCGRPLTEGMTCTQAEADTDLEHKLPAYESVVRDLCPKATAGQFAALVSFAWNEGTHQVHFITDRMNAGHLQAAADEFLRFTRSGDKPLLLKGRRETERNVFLGTLADPNRIG